VWKKLTDIRRLDQPSPLNGIIGMENDEAWHPIPESGLTRAEYGFELRESIQETTGIGLPSPICSRPRSSHRHPMRGGRCARKPGFVSVSATVGSRCPALPRESGGGWAIRRSLGGAEVRLCFGASGIWRRMGNLSPRTSMWTQRRRRLMSHTLFAVRGFRACIGVYSRHHSHPPLYIRS